MAKPRVFVSSTYYDLKHVRASIEIFIENLGFEPVLSEYGSIAYDPTQPLDESCYREAQSSDILVLIIGGRYGSAASSQSSSAKKRDEEFESVTRREFARAHDADIPVYVLVEQGVHSEYQTYLKNKDNTSIKYAHVDSVKVFNFIEYIYSKQRNNPVKSFEKESDIENWLRDQWAGLFQELLRQRKDSSKFADLASQIRHLEAVNTTLKSYLETLLQSVTPEVSSDVIERENISLSKSELLEKSRKNYWFEHVLNRSELDPGQALDLHLSIKQQDEIFASFRNAISDSNRLIAALRPLVEVNNARIDFNDLRRILGKQAIAFSSAGIEELRTALVDIQEDLINEGDSSEIDISDIDYSGLEDSD